MEYLDGGSGGVWRVDDPELGLVVHRPTGPWTPAVHELLAFLADAELDGVPTVHGYDSEGREVLSFLAGDALDPGVREPTDEMVMDAAAWLRRYHDVVRDWRPGHRTWRQVDRDLEPGELICHNDAGTYNWVIRDGRFAGIIDWDQAGPGHPLDDLAFLCWTAAPLYVEAPDAARRVRLAAEAYGGVSADEVLDAVAPRLLRSVERISAGIARRDPGMLALLERGEPERTRLRVEDFLTRLPAIRVGGSL